MSNQKSIFLIDDNSDDRSLTEVLLAQILPDFDIHAIKDPVALGEFLAIEAPAAAVIEGHLAWCDSVGLVRKIKAKNKDCIIILYSQEGMKSFTPELADLGLTAYLSKTPGDLIKIPGIIKEKIKTPPREQVITTQTLPAQILEGEAPTEDLAHHPVADIAPHLAVDVLPTLAAYSETAFLTELFREISHDLTQPLQILVRQAKLLEETYKKQVDSKEKSLIKNMVNVASHIQLLLDSILSYHQLDKSHDNDIKADIGESLATVLATLETTLNEISARVWVGKLPALLLSKAKMVQLFQNLLNNAIKFRSEQPLYVEIEALDVTHSWLFSIKDNGIGIEETQLDGIFGIFNRLHPQEKYPGYGIGLSICKRIIEQQGGKIWARSEHGEGTTIYFTIPKESENPLHSKMDQDGL